MMYLFRVRAGGIRQALSLQSIDDAWDVTEDREEDTDEEVRIASTLEEDTKRSCFSLVQLARLVKEGITFVARSQI